MAGADWLQFLARPQVLSGFGQNVTLVGGVRPDRVGHADNASIQQGLQVAVAEKRTVRHACLGHQLRQASRRNAGRHDAALLITQSHWLLSGQISRCLTVAVIRARRVFAENIAVARLVASGQAKILS